jgi:hypothetical protein
VRDDRGERRTVPQVDVEVVGTGKGNRIDLSADVGVGGARIL